MKKLKVAEAKLIADVIGGMQAMNVQASFNFGLNLALNRQVLEPFAKEHEKKRQEFMTQFAKKGPAGERLEKDGEPDWIAGGREAFLAAMEAFGEEEVELPLILISRDDAPKELGAMFAQGVSYILEQQSAETAGPARRQPKRKA